MSDLEFYREYLIQRQLTDMEAALIQEDICTITDDEENNDE